MIPAADLRTEVSTIGSALRAIDTKRIYYKYCATFDCTDEGNIGPAAETLLSVTGSDRVIFAPAFPRRIQQHTQKSVP